MLINDNHIFLNHHEEIRNFSADFLKTINCTYLDFYRIYKNNDFIVFSTHSEWIYRYYNIYYSKIPHADTYDSFKKFDYIIWDIWPESDIENKRVLELTKKIYSLQHWFTIIHQEKGYIDSFSFACNKYSDMQNILYLNNLPNIAKWSFEFRGKISRLISEGEKNLLSFQSNKHDILENKSLLPDNINKFYFDSKNYITKKEFEVVCGLINGMTLKEIAHLNEISPRTVEHHLNALKHKMGVKYKSGVIKKFLSLNLMRYVFK